MKGLCAEILLYIDACMPQNHGVVTHQSMLSC